MKGFMLKDGDLIITANSQGKRDIEMVSGNELTAQTIQSVISTNQGEWIFDTDEGINFDNILGKHKIKSASTNANNALVKECAAKQASNNALAERLRKRLDGE